MQSIVSFKSIVAWDEKTVLTKTGILDGKVSVDELPKLLR
ncbi:hypothetical protein GCM10025794_30890 [Massilia kyonggiensis]